MTKTQHEGMTDKGHVAPPTTPNSHSTVVTSEHLQLINFTLSPLSREKTDHPTMQVF